MRIVIDYSKDEVTLDYNYWNSHGWLDADYFSNSSINPVKKQLAKFVGWMIRRQIDKGESKPVVK